MRSRNVCSGSWLALLAGAAGLLVYAGTLGLRPTTSKSPQVDLARLPLTFEPNVGQTEGRVAFLSRAPECQLFLTADTAVLSLNSGSNGLLPTHTASSRRHGPEPGRGLSCSPAPTERTNLKMRLLGANRHAPMDGLDPLPGKVNYLVGNDRSRWRRNVPTYARVRQREVYPGIDLVYYGNGDGRLEHDFVVHAGAQPRQLRLGYSRAWFRGIGPNGDLVFAPPGGELRQRKPVAYQEIDGRRVPVPCAYELPGPSSSHEPVHAPASATEQVVAFRVGAYDPTRPLVIDPTLDYSTFLGGSGADSAHGVAVDDEGNVYVAGAATSLDFPVSDTAYQHTNRTLGNFTAIVSKLSLSGGSLIYSTYLGGTRTGYASAIDVDLNGEAYVTGQTFANDFPVTLDAFQRQFGSKSPMPANAFVTILTDDGSDLSYSTYLGGSGPKGFPLIQDAGLGISVNSNKSFAVCGVTVDPDFPLTVPVQITNRASSEVTGFVAYFDGLTRSNVVSTYFGAETLDEVTAIKLDEQGNGYITGYTQSDDLPVTDGVFQTTSHAEGSNAANAFVAKIRFDGTEVLSATYLGGSGSDAATGIALGPDGSVYVTGQAKSGDFPTTSGAFQTRNAAAGSGNAFVTRMSPELTSLLFSTFLGGSGSGDGATGIAVDAHGNAYVTGSATSGGFPTTRDAVQTSNSDSHGAAFFAELADTGKKLIYSTFMSGSGNAQSHGGDKGMGIAVDASGAAYVAGFTASANFPVTLGAYQTHLNSTLGTNAFVARFAFSVTESSIHVTLEHDPVLAGTPIQGNALPVLAGGESLKGWKVSVAFQQLGHTLGTAKASGSDFHFSFTPRSPVTPGPVTLLATGSGPSGASATGSATVTIFTLELKVQGNLALVPDHSPTELGVGEHAALSFVTNPPGIPTDTLGRATWSMSGHSGMLTDNMDGTASFEAGYTAGKVKFTLDLGSSRFTNTQTIVAPDLALQIPYPADPAVHHNAGVPSVGSYRWYVVGGTGVSFENVFFLEERALVKGGTGSLAGLNGQDHNPGPEVPVMLSYDATLSPPSWRLMDGTSDAVGYQAQTVGKGKASVSIPVVYQVNGDPQNKKYPIEKVVEGFAQDATGTAQVSKGGDISTAALNLPYSAFPPLW